MKLYKFDSVYEFEFSRIKQETYSNLPFIMKQFKRIYIYNGKELIKNDIKRTNYCLRKVLKK